MAAKVYQLVRELFVKQDDRIRLVVSGIVHLVRDTWLVALKTHAIVARDLKLSAVCCYTCNRGCF